MITPIQLDQEILGLWQTELMENPLHINDQMRRIDYVRASIGDTLAGSQMATVYEIRRGDERCGIIMFHHIIDGLKATLSMLLWDARGWTPRAVREAKELIAKTMENHNLARIGTETVDPRVRKMAEIIGFEFEGEKVNDFLCNGELLNTYVLGYVRGKED